MNIQEFEKNAKNLDNYEWKFKEFRTYVVNFYECWLKDRDVAWHEEEQEFKDPYMFIGSEKHENFIYQWDMISLYDASVLYSKLGLESGGDFTNKKIQYSFDSFYYSENIENMFDIIKRQESDIKFCYGILVLMNIVQNKQLFLKNCVLRGLKEYGLEECQKIINEGKKSVFVAMWFDEKMKYARARIEKAISDCGYTPILIDVKQHNGQIVPEIFKEIDNSEFVVADLTGQRGGVYYEAGYAMAKEKQVILCCKQGKKSTHFDVAQINTIYWKDEDDLYERLVKRIKSTIGENL